MWKKTAVILVVLSVAMNLAFIGVWGFHAVGSRCRRGGSCRDMSEKGGIWCPLHRELGIDQKQWEQIEPRLVEFRKASQAVCQEVNSRRAEMIGLIAAPESDSEAIRAKQEEILAGQRKMQELTINHLLTEKKILKPEQQEAFFRMFRQRSGCAGHGPMMNTPGEECKGKKRQ
jgi:Spy/CpxP family protein refolding chaperone